MESRSVQASVRRVPRFRHEVNAAELPEGHRCESEGLIRGAAAVVTSFDRFVSYSGLRLAVSLRRMKLEYHCDGKSQSLLSQSGLLTSRDAFRIRLNSMVIIRDGQAYFEGSGGTHTISGARQCWN